MNIPPPPPPPTRGGQAAIVPSLWERAAEEFRKMALEYSMMDKSEHMFKMVYVQKARHPKPSVPVHINYDMLTNEQETTQAILSALDQLDAMTIKCDRLEEEVSLWKEEADRWRNIASDRLRECDDYCNDQDRW